MTIPIFRQTNPKTIEVYFSFLNLYQHVKNQFFSSIHSWGTISFIMLRLDCPHPFWHPYSEMFESIFMNTILSIHSTDIVVLIFFCHFGHFCPFTYPSNDPKINIFKKWKKVWIYHHNNNLLFLYMMASL